MKGTRRVRLGGWPAAANNLRTRAAKLALLKALGTNCEKRGRSHIGALMPFRLNHIHIKSPEPRQTAEWWVKAFDFKILSDETRVWGDRFIRCQAGEGMVVTFSSARTNETLGPGDVTPHHGLEHFGIDTGDIEADIARLVDLGAKLLEGPIQNPNGPRVAFLSGPHEVRFE
jgi:lactoylglutathione lyase